MLLYNKRYKALRKKAQDVRLRLSGQGQSEEVCRSVDATGAGLAVTDLML